jgi:ubiquinone/menaquinone biosynthesis C-methylase UbiE
MSEAKPNYRARIKSSEAVAVDYNTRKQGKHAGELHLVERALGTLQDVHTVLDAPCGTGRFVIFLSENGYIPTGLDLGDGALAQAANNCEAAGIEDSRLVKGDLEGLQFEDDAFDAILCFRLFHHLPNPEVRDRVVGELCRVADKYVMISWFDPRSFTSMKRSLRARFFGKESRQYSTALDEVSGYFQGHGYELSRNFARMPYFHTLNLAVFARIQGV